MNPIQLVEEFHLHRNQQLAASFTKIKLAYMFSTCAVDHELEEDIIVTLHLVLRVRFTLNKYDLVYQCSAAPSIHSKKVAEGLNDRVCFSKVAVHLIEY